MAGTPQPTTPAPDNGEQITAPQPSQQQAAPQQPQQPVTEDEVEEIDLDGGDDISGSDIESLSEEQLNELLAMPEEDDVEEEPQQAQPPRDQNGRFMPRDTRQQPQPRQQAQQPQAQQQPMPQEQEQFFDPANDPRRPPGYVPAAALQQARQEAREAARRSREAEELLVALSARLMQAPQPQQAPQPEGTKPFDPIESIQRLEERFQQQDQQKAQEEARAKALATAEAQVNRYAQEFDEDARDNPVLGNAWEYLKESLAAEWREFHSDRISLDRFVKAAIWEHGRAAEAKRQPFAQRIARVAMTRGWNPRAAQQQPRQQQAQPQPRQQQDVRAFEQAAQRIGNIEQAQRQNPSMAGAASGDNAGLSLKAILSMPAEQLEAFARANPNTVERIHRLANGIR